ncbi:MAG: multicopper oxidase domain-containing protein [Halioglobus sp.]
MATSRAVRSLLLPLLTLSLLYTTPTKANRCDPTTDGITDPPQFSWQQDGQGNFVGTLEMGAVELLMNNGETLTTRAYRQEGGQYSIPGPTIKMAPGNTYILRFKNLLPYQPLSGLHNEFSDPDVTNVHTHGLHISGETPSDDVTRAFEGGRGGDYVYQIDADHMGGTFWYHAHKHGSTFLQVSSGAFGLMIIDDAQDGLPPNVAAMAEQQLIFGFLDTDVAGTGGDTRVGGSLGPTWTVNGKIAGDICIPPNTWQHWRILVADRDAKNRTLTVGEGCEVALLSRDGVWRTRAPKMLPTRDIVLTGASRADLAVRCTADTDVSLGNQSMAQILIDGTADTGPHPFAQDSASQWSAVRPNYLRDLSNEVPTGSETIRMGARTINGRKYNATQPNLELYPDGVQEWNLKGATNHPFHLHIYHVQVMGNCGDYEDGEFYDVVSDACRVRFDLNPNTASVFAGRTIMHCHILEHEDQGAMGWMNVLSENGARSAPILPAGYSPYYEFGGPGPETPPAAPGNFVATTLSSSEIGLTWDDNSTDENNFEIQRTGGSSATIPVGANSTSYTDSGLAENTSYSYTIAAVNEAGSSDVTGPAEAVTDPQVSGAELIVTSISVGTTSVGRGNKQGTATITINDNAGNPVSGVDVSGTFTGDYNQQFNVENSGAQTTDQNGVVTFTTDDVLKGGVSFEFCVTVVAGDFPWNETAGQSCATF